MLFYKLPVICTYMHIDQLNLSGGIMFISKSYRLSKIPVPGMKYPICQGGPGDPFPPKKQYRLLSLLLVTR